MTGSQGPREALLAAALDALRDLTVESLLASIGVREIARRAGVSPATIYRHYESMAGLAAAVTDHVYDPGVTDLDATLAYVRGIQEAQLPLDTTFILHGAELDRLSHDEQFPLRVGLWAFGGPDARATYRTYLQEVEGRLVQVASTLFESWGRTLRAPFDMRSYLAARTALVNGSTVRHSVEPDIYTRDHYQRVATAIDLVLLRVDGDRHSVDGRLSEMNYYPLTRAAGPADSERGRATHARILNAAASAFSTRGYDDTTLAHVAAAADVSTTTLHRYYRTKHALASGLFSQQASDLLPLVDPDAEPQAALLDVLAALADLVPPRVAPATAYFTDVMLTRDSGEADPLVTTLASLVGSTELAASGTAEDSARLLIGLTLREALNHPDRPPATNAAAARDQVLGGLDRHVDAPPGQAHPGSASPP